MKIKRNKLAATLITLLLLVFLDAGLAKNYSSASGNASDLGLSVSNLSYDYNYSFYPERIVREELQGLCRIKLVAGEEDVEINSIRFYGEKENGEAITQNDISSASLYSVDDYLQDGTWDNGYWTFTAFQLKIPAGGFKLLEFRANFSKETSVENFRVVTNEKYISAKGLQSGKEIGMDNIENGGWQNSADTDFSSRWFILHESDAKLPNLNLQRMHITPTNPLVEDEVCLYASIRNFGFGDVESEDIIVNAYVNGEYAGEASFGNSIKKMEEEITKKVFCSRITDGGFLKKGNNEVKIKVDSGDNIIETREDNNERTFNFSIIDGGSGAKFPDLIVLDADCHISMGWDDYVVCNYKIKNIGETAVSGKFQIAANGKEKDSFATPQPGKWTNGTIGLDLPMDGKVTVKVDYNNTIHESNENNNTLEVGIDGYRNYSGTKDLTNRDLVKSSNDSRIYLIEGNRRFWIKTAKEFQEGGYEWEDVKIVSDETLNKYKIDSYISGRICRDIFKGKVFHIINGKWLWIPSLEVFNAQGLKWDDVSDVMMGDIHKYPRLKLAREKGSDKIYYIANSGMKKLIINDEVFRSYGDKYYEVVELDKIILDSLPTVRFVRSKNGAIYEIKDNTKTWIKTSEEFKRAGGNWSEVSPVNDTELDAYLGGNDVIDSVEDIPDGSVVRATGSDDVYIIKYIGNKKFKRLILNPYVFKSYGHLKWDNVKNVGQSLLNEFVASDLVTVCQEADVYINCDIYKLIAGGDDGEKFLVSKDEIKYGRYDLDSVYVINDTDLGSYSYKKKDEKKTKEEAKEIYIADFCQSQVQLFAGVLETIPSYYGIDLGIENKSEFMEIMNKVIVEEKDSSKTAMHDEFWDFLNKEKLSDTEFENLKFLMIEGISYEKCIYEDLWKSLENGKAFKSNERRNIENRTIAKYSNDLLENDFKAVDAIMEQAAGIGEIGTGEYYLEDIFLQFDNLKSRFEQLLKK